MNTEKIILKDGSAIDIQSGASSYLFTSIVSTLSEFENIFARLTEYNLEEYKLLNADGMVCAIEKNRRCKSSNISTCETGYCVVFNLEDVDMIEKRLAALEETADFLVEDSLV